MRSRPGHAAAARRSSRSTARSRSGRWQRFEADWLLAPPEGFIWAARTQVGPLSIAGFDRYTGGAGEMRWRLFGVVPFIGASGPDVSRSAMGRLAAELCFVPAVALSPALRWEEIDSHRVAVHVNAHGWSHRVTLTIGSSGGTVSRRRPTVGQSGPQAVPRAPVQRDIPQRGAHASMVSRSLRRHTPAGGSARTDVRRGASSDSRSTVSVTLSAAETSCRTGCASKSR